ncbi:SulP family sulfate permease [Fonsecaea erecta]|uniref:SulP family sulfate permease n=1 Tax=Fonsecaea erecta TaxID=1367422 RepID=A0A178ZW18_9EURO|nr:SulP family sulfate permease [Fonsecaea erecta]OAP63225.1 SulP family sulfate permease [Fonsecaea erecta]
MAAAGSDERQLLLKTCTQETDLDNASASSKDDRLSLPKSERITMSSSQRHHHRGRKLARLSRHLPFIKWVPEYQWKWLPGDFMGALTVASLYVPLSISFSLLGHAHPISGLYSFVITPLLYALLGSCPLMVVGPEAPGSLLVGTVVALSGRGNEDEQDQTVNAQIAGTVTAFTGSILFLTGLSRLGFVDSVLSRPFMRGFIGAVGLNVVISQTITGLGLGPLAKEDPIVSGGSPARKLLFTLTNLTETHFLTAVISVTSFTIVMIVRHFRSVVELRYPGMAYFPDRFVVIASTTFLTWLYSWHEHGLQVLGRIRTPENLGVPFRWPFTFHNVDNISSLITTAFVIALLGLFESSLTARSLRKANAANKASHIPLNSNQELIALGVANIVSGCFLALPGFGGYGRSKLNFSVGGRTPMSNVLLSAITLICIFFALPAFYYIPRGVLAAMIAIVGVSMIEECPHEIAFFAKIRAWPELSLMALVFGATIFHSITLGMTVGLAWSIVSLLLRRGWRSTVRIRDSSTQALQDGDLAHMAALSSMRTVSVTVSGHLTFANSGNLKDRLQALDHDAASAPEPSHSPIINNDTSHQKRDTETVLIFDMRHCTSIDGCAVQALTEIIEHHHAVGGTQIIIWKPLQSHVGDDIQNKLTLSGGAAVSLGEEDRNVSFITTLEEIRAIYYHGETGQGSSASVFESLDML